MLVNINLDLYKSCHIKNTYLSYNIPKHLFDKIIDRNKFYYNDLKFKTRNKQKNKFNIC